MSVVQIPLDRNPDVAALLADKDPGARVYACFTIKSQDPQTAQLRIEEFADSPEDLSKPDDEYDEDEEEDADHEKAESDKEEKAEHQSPEGKEADAEPFTGKAKGSMGRELAAKMMGGDSSF